MALSFENNAGFLDRLKVASPCSADWDAMIGDDRVRFCGLCKKNVYNLSAMARAEAEALLRANEGDLCTRMAQRADGTLVTSDCPVGAKKRRVRLAVLSFAGPSALGIGMALTGCQQEVGTIGESSSVGVAATNSVELAGTGSIDVAPAGTPSGATSSAATARPPRHVPTAVPSQEPVRHLLGKVAASKDW